MLHLFSMLPDGDQVGLPALRARRLLTSALLCVGIGIFVLSFSLPAVNAYDLDLDGFACSWLSLCSVGDGMSISSLAFLGGLINPVAITYSVLRVLGRAPNLRKGLSTAILFFIPITWLSLALMRYGIRVGHVAWILGLLLMIDWSDLGHFSRLRRAHARA